jgi:outer membrane murein-binding lipoprotein Lpp
MRTASALLMAAALGAIVSVGVGSAAQSAKPVCSSATDLSPLYKRFDDLEQAVTALQTQSAKAASDTSLANANNQRQLANISSQVADLNSQVVALRGSVRR